MIVSFVMIIKLARLNLTAQALTDILLQSSSYSSSMYCRKCRSSNIRKRCDYTRKITNLKNGKWIDYELKTVRFICDGCSSTHAFLVPLVIPYGRHSVPLVIRALYEYYDSGSVNTVCEKYQITAPTLYHRKKLFLKHKEEWLGYLKDAETKASLFLKELLNDTDYSDFVRQFICPYRSYCLFSGKTEICQTQTKEKRSSLSLGVFHYPIIVYVPFQTDTAQ